MANKEIDVKIQETNGTELAVAQAQAPAPAVTDTPISHRVQFSHPYDWEGQTVDHLDVDLSKVSGRDCKTISRMLETTGEINPMAVLPEFTIPYILQLVAFATQMPIEFMETLDWADVMKLKIKVIGFFGA